MLSCAYCVVSLQLINRDVIILLPCRVSSCMVGQHDLCCNTILLVVFLQTALCVWFGSGGASSSGDVTVLLVLVHSRSRWYLLRVHGSFLSCLQPPFCHERNMYYTAAGGLQVCFVLPLPPWAVLVL